MSVSGYVCAAPAAVLLLFLFYKITVEDASKTMLVLVYPLIVGVGLIREWVYFYRLLPTRRFPLITMVSPKTLHVTPLSCLEYIAA